MSQRLANRYSTSSASPMAIWAERLTLPATTMEPMNEDQINDIVVDSLKDTFEMQFKSLSDHRDDIVFQHQVKEACKVLLSYYMIPSEAAGYIEDVEESN